MEVGRGSRSLNFVPVPEEVKLGFLSAFTDAGRGLGCGRS